MPTEAALHFVGSATWEALSGHPVRTGVFSDVPDVPHVRLGQQADLVLVAPATADLLARAAHGMADDLLAATLLTARCPVLMAPAMHTEMWEHPATQANVVTLRERGVLVLEPATGRLTGTDSGAGRLPEPDDLLACARALLDHPGQVRDLAGRRVLVTAGSTAEPLDPVRYLTNHSSGRQGWALARVAAMRGADVTLVAGHSEMPDPSGITTVRVSDARAMQTEVDDLVPDMNAIVMAAAVADHRPAQAATTKIKKTAGSGATRLDLVENPDILAGVAARSRADQVVVGFAAETGDASATVLDLGRRKLAEKGCDLLVVNEVGGATGFGSLDNEAVILAADGATVPVALGSKERLAAVVWDEVVSRLPGTLRAT